MGVGRLPKPTPGRIRAFLSAQGRAEFSYRHVGATAGTPPAGFAVDHTRARLGSGEAAFAAAVVALKRWEHFRLGWVEAWSPEAEIRAGTHVAVVARAFGMWWLNACRVVDVVDEHNGTIRRWGFAYGTLPAHVERGEERFLVEWDRNDDGVWYDILAFSRPCHPLARLAYPLTRRLQRRFARDSVAAMIRATAGGAGGSVDSYWTGGADRSSS